MCLFAFVMASLGIFVYLLWHFSFWAAIGATYMLGMILVVFFVGFSKQQTHAQMMLNKSTDIELIK